VLPDLVLVATSVCLYVSLQLLPTYLSFYRILKSVTTPASRSLM
jgi:hypothetical protein